MASRNKRMPRRFLALCILLFASCAYGVELPETINEWHLTNEYITRLIPDVNSKDLGQIVYLDYARETPAGTLQIIITHGAGIGALYVPEKVNASKGLMPSDSGYEILEIAGKKAIIESQSFMPLVLAINVDDNTILTIESISLNHDEIINFAEKVLSSWNVTKLD